MILQAGQSSDAAADADGESGRRRCRGRRADEDAARGAPGGPSGPERLARVRRVVQDARAVDDVEGSLAQASGERRYRSPRSGDADRGRTARGGFAAAPRVASDARVRSAPTIVRSAVARKRLICPVPHPDRARPPSRRPAPPARGGARTRSSRRAREGRRECRWADNWGNGERRVGTTAPFPSGRSSEGTRKSTMPSRETINASYATHARRRRERVLLSRVLRAALSTRDTRADRARDAREIERIRRSCR